MSREYAISSGDFTLAGASTLLFLNPGTTTTLEILRMWVSQSANTTSVQQRIQVVTQVSAFPTVATGVTPRPLKVRDPASLILAATDATECTAGEAGVDATAEGAGAKTVMWEDTFNAVNGWLWVPTPYETIILSASFASGLGIYFPATPGTAAGWNAGLIFREL